LIIGKAAPVSATELGGAVKPRPLLIPILGTPALSEATRKY
jgi:hypothetical protein